MVKIINSRRYFMKITPKVNIFFDKLIASIGNSKKAMDRLKHNNHDEKRQ